MAAPKLTHGTIAAPHHKGKGISQRPHVPPCPRAGDPRACNAALSASAADLTRSQIQTFPSLVPATAWLAVLANDRRPGCETSSMRLQPRAPPGSSRPRSQCAHRPERRPTDPGAPEFADQRRDPRKIGLVVDAE